MLSPSRTVVVVVREVELCDKTAVRRSILRNVVWGASGFVDSPSSYSWGVL